MNDQSKQVDQLAALITLAVANGLKADLEDIEKRTPQLYNAAINFLKNLKFEVDPDAAHANPALGELAKKLADIPMPDELH